MQQVRRLHHRLFLRYLYVEHGFYQWRRSIAELRNLTGHTSFLAEAQAEQAICCPKSVKGVKPIVNDKAHKECLAHIYADRIPRDHRRLKQALNEDLRHGRRGSVLVDGFLADNGDTVSSLGSVLLLLCGPTVTAKT